MDIVERTWCAVIVFDYISVMASPAEGPHAILTSIQLLHPPNLFVRLFHLSLSQSSPSPL
jgi:hypothetical protein